jgi:hypothetical protein
MRTSAQRRGMALPILCLFVLAIAACDKKASAVAADPNDPNSPAVVKEPAPILVGDTLKPKVPLVDTARFRQTVRNEYAIMAMMMISHDGRSLVTEFEPNATIAYPDSTVQSSVRIAKYLIDFAASKSVMDFQRASEKFQLTDSAATDSGRYRIFIVSQFQCHHQHRILIVLPRPHRQKSHPFMKRDGHRIRRLQIHLERNTGPSPPCKRRHIVIQ